MVSRSLLILPALLFVVMPACQGFAADWPTYAADNARSGSTSESLETALKPVWKVKAPAVPQLAWSSAEGRVIEGKLLGARIRFDDAFRTVVADGRVYFGSTVDHQLQCRDLTSGKLLWTFFTGGPIRLAPTVNAGHVYFGSDDGRVYCIDAVTGKPVWQRQVAPLEEWLLARGTMVSKWPVRTGVLVHDGVAYFGAGIFPHEDVYLLGVDAATGRLLWQEDNISSQEGGRNDLSPQGYLLADQDLLVVPSGGSLPAVFDVESKKLLHKRTHSWRTTAGGVVGGTRGLMADGQLYASGPHHFLAMEGKTGDVGFGWFDGRQMAIQGDAAYVVTGTRVARLDRLAYAVASRKRHELEERIYRLSRSNRPDENGNDPRDLIRQATEELKSLANDGIVWQAETTDDQSIIVTGNVVVVGGEGRVTAYSKEDGSVVWKSDVNGGARGLSVADGHLLVSTDAGEVVCFGSGSAAETRASGGSQDRTASAAASNAEMELYRRAAGQILKQTGITRGYCLVVDGEEGRLAEELARQSELKMYCVEEDSAKVDTARKRLSAAGLYGHRITVHQHSSADIPYSHYFANLIVSDRLVRDGTADIDWAAVAPHLKPLGGVICLGSPAELPSATDPKSLQAALKSCGLEEQSTIETADGWVMLRRGALPGAGDWSHQYGSPANTAVANDTRISGGLGVLWYGDPGPGDMVNRHEGAVGPLSVDGRLFVQGDDTIKAYDAYNGVHLWTFENPEAIRTGVFQNQNPGNLAAGESSLFQFAGDKCVQLSMATGETEAIHSLPPGRDEGKHEWGYVAVENGILFGTATIRQALAAQLRRRGKVTEDSTDALFAIDVATGKHLWSYEGGSISHHTIAISPDRLFFIDSTITSEQRAEILRQDKSELAHLTGEARQIAEQRLKKADLRLAVALDIRTGEKLWENPVDVTDCSEIGIGGGKLTMMYSDGALVLCGANANGHYWSQFVSGEFKRRRLVALSAEDGYKLWAKDANYRHRPIIIGEHILAEPWMYDLKTGEQIMRPHPVTGEEVPWSIMRTGHHCGMLTACDSGMVLFRSGSTGFFDLNSDDGVRHFGGHRLGCWINAIAANGLVMIPEASAGCVCQFSIASTIVLEPRAPRRPWTIYSAVGAATPVKHLAVNLGAPGDRKDPLGQVWLSYPRQQAYRETSLDVELPLEPKFYPGGDFTNVSDTRPVADGTETPWIYTSWADGLQQITLPLLGEKDPPARYTIRLHFADGRAALEEPARFDVIINGQRILTDLSTAPAAGKPLQPDVRDIRHVSVERDVVIEFQAKAGRPLLNAVEAIREQAD